MSTATLLILSARLRSFGHAERPLDPAPSAPSFGRGRVTWSAAFKIWMIAFQRGSAGDRSPQLPRAWRPANPLACADAAWALPRRVRDLVLAGLGFLIGSIPALAAEPVQAPLADQTDRPQAPASTGETPCVMVDIAGERAGELECANGELTDTSARAKAASEQARARVAEALKRSDVARGVANTAATRLRTESHAGRGVAVPANTMGRRP